MDRILLGLGAAGASLLIIAIVVAWWEHRRHTAELRRQLAWSENTRDMLQAHAKDVETRLQALAASVQAHNESHQVKASLEPEKPFQANKLAPTPLAAPTPTPSALAAAATAAAAGAVVQQWKDTEPMVLTGAAAVDLDFDPTLPTVLTTH